MTVVEYLELEAPADDFDEPALSLIARYVATANRVTQDFWGDDSRDTTVDEILASMRHQEDEIVRRFLVVEDGQVVGRVHGAFTARPG